jgi:hypothetical protein
MKIFLIIAVVMVPASSSAQENFSFYGANGNYEGSATTNGSQTYYHGSSGELLGSSNTVGNQMNFYGSSGNYVGHIQENNYDN